jgi:uncharacterized membrane protein
MNANDLFSWKAVDEDTRNSVVAELKSSYPEELSNCNTIEEINEWLILHNKPDDFEKQKQALQQEIKRIEQINVATQVKELCSLKKKLYYINNKDKIQQYRKELYQKSKQKQRAERKELLSSMSPSEIDTMRYKQQSYYLKNKDKILKNARDKRREFRNADIKDKVVCKECNKEYLRSNLARHVRDIHPWIINYKEGY